MSTSDSFSMSKNGGAPSGVSVVGLIESSLMGVWHVMTEQLDSSSLTRWINLALILFDALTVLSLAVSRDSLLAPFLRVTIQDLLPAHNTTVLAVVYGIVQVIIWFAIFDAVFVAWSFAIGRFRALWPALALRAIIGVVGTALYNPFLEVLVIPLRCDYLKYYWDSPTVSTGHRLLSSIGGGESGVVEPLICTDSTLVTPQIVMIVLSLLSLLSFIPFALLTQLVYVESNPASFAWDAMSSGRDNVLDSVIRTILVFVTFFSKDSNPIAHSAIFIVFLSYIAFKIITTLPFYLPWYNMLRVGLYGASIWVAIESITLGNLKKNSVDYHTLHDVSTIFVGLLIPVSIIFAFLPLWQYRRLRNNLARVLLAVEEIETKAAKEAEEAVEREENTENDGPATKLTRAMSHAISFISQGSTTLASAVQEAQKAQNRSNKIRPLDPELKGSTVVTSTRAVTKNKGASSTSAESNSSVQGDNMAPILVPGATAITIASASGKPNTGTVPASPNGTAIPINEAIDVLEGKISYRGNRKKDTIRSRHSVTSEEYDDELICVTGLRSRVTAEAARRFRNDPELVEHMAIYVLKLNWNPANVPTWQHNINVASGLYTRKAIGIAGRVFEHGLIAFPNHPGVRVAYARFLSTFEKDSSRAIGMLQSVIKCAPHLEERFAIFSFGRSLDQKRQSSDLGEGELDAVGIIAFRQTQSQALRHHSTAVSQILALWKMIDSRTATIGTMDVTATTNNSDTHRSHTDNSRNQGNVRSTGAPSSSITAAMITEQIAKIVESRRRAQMDYDKLLARYPNAVLLLRSYASFLNDVLNEPAWATTINNRIDALVASEKADTDNLDIGDKKSAYQSVAGFTRKNADGSASQANSSGGGSWGRRSMASSRNMENAGTRSVSSMRWKMQLGLVSLAFLASIIFGVTRYTLDDFSSLIDVIFYAGRRRYMVVGIGFHSRTATLSAGKLLTDLNHTKLCSPTETCYDIFQDARQNLIELSKELQTINADLYNPNDNVRMFDTVKNIYDYEGGYKTNQVDIGPPPVNITVYYGLQALLVKYAGNAYACSQMPIERIAKCCNNYCDDPVVWRFIQDSWYQALTGADDAVNAYVDRAFEIMDSFEGIAFGLLSVVIVLVFGLWSCVFWPAALSVQRSNAGVLAIADTIPREAIRALIKRYTRLVQQLDELSEQVSGEAKDDAESDRGMSSDEDESENDSKNDVDSMEKNSDDYDEEVHELHPEFDQGHEHNYHHHHHHHKSGDGQHEHHSTKEFHYDIDEEKSSKYATPSTAITRLTPGSRHILSPVKEDEHEASFHSSNQNTFSSSNSMPRKSSMRVSSSNNHKLGRNVSFGREENDIRNAINDMNNNNNGSNNNRMRLSLRNVQSPGTMLAQGEFDHLRRVGMSASNLLDQMQEENNDFAYKLAVATGGVGSDVASKSVRLAQSFGTNNNEEKEINLDNDTTGAKRNTKPLSTPPIRATVHSNENQNNHSPVVLPNAITSPGTTSASPKDGPKEKEMFNISEAKEINNSAEINPPTLIHDETTGKEFKHSDTTDIGSSTQSDSVHISFEENVDPKSNSSMENFPLETVSEILFPHTSTTTSTTVSPVKQPLNPSFRMSKSVTSTGRRSSISHRDINQSTSEILSQVTLSNTTHNSHHELIHTPNVNPAHLKVQKSFGQYVMNIIRTFWDWCVQTSLSFAVVLGLLNTNSNNISSKKSNIAARLSPLLRTLSSRVALALVTVIILQTIAAVLSFVQVEVEAYTASAINVAGYRRELAITAMFQARELLVGPDIIGTYELAVDTMRQYTDDLAFYHNALLLGDKSLRLRASRGTSPEQDKLLNDANEDAFTLTDLANASKSELLRLTYSTQGLDYLVMRYVDDCNGFLARFEPWLASLGKFDYVYQRYGQNLTENWLSLSLGPPRDRLIGVDYTRSVRHNLDIINNDAGFAQLQEIAFKLLDKKLEYSMNLYLDYTKAQEMQSSTIQIVVYILNLGIIAFLQWGVFARQFANLAAEAQRTQELLRLIPNPILESMPKAVKATLSLTTSNNN